MRGANDRQNLEAKKSALTEKLVGLRLSDDVAELVKRADDAVQGFKAETNDRPGTCLKCIIFTTRCES